MAMIHNLDGCREQAECFLRVAKGGAALNSHVPKFLDSKAEPGPKAAAAWAGAAAKETT